VTRPLHSFKVWSFPNKSELFEKHSYL
jgi:hypothetical protein